jgi:hypothetical protein
LAAALGTWFSAAPVGAHLMVYSAQEVEMSAQDKPKKTRAKPSRSYEPPAQEPVVGEPYEAPPRAYQSTQAEPILASPSPQDPPYPYDPPPPGYGYDAGPAYGSPPPDPSPGYGSPPNDPPAGRPGTNGPPRPRIPPGGVSPTGRAAAYARLVTDTSRFMTESRQNLVSSGAAAPDGALGMIATNAIQDVLGWQIKRSPDAKGFVNALKQSFSLNVSEGYVQATWTPHTHVAQNDVAGGLAGAQSSIFTMANTILEKALPLIDGLSPLKPGYDQLYVAVLQQTAASQLSALVAELGYLSGPRIMRVNQCFRVLMGIPINANGDLPDGQVEFWTDPDGVAGTMGNMRDAMGLGAVASTYVNNVADEQNVTNFRCIVDYINAIFNSWRNSMQFFTTMQSPFLGTQLVWISMQLGVVNEAVEELRFVLDSVFIGEAERKTLVLSGLTVGLPASTLAVIRLAGNAPPPSIALPDITLSGLLGMIQSLVTRDGPDIIETGGRFGIGEYFSVMVEQLRDYVSATIGFAQAQSYSALNTNRVLVALSKLERQLDELLATARTVGIPSLPPPSVNATISQS